MNKYPNTGAIFPRQKRNPKAADFGGDVTLEGDVVDYIIRCAERGEEVKIDISAWKRQTNSGGTMLSLKVELPFSERQGGQNYGGRQQQGGRPPIRTSNGPYRGGGQREDYQPREDYGRGNQRHDTQMGGSYRSGGGQQRRGYDDRNPPPQRDFGYDDMNDPLDNL